MRERQRLKKRIWRLMLRGREAVSSRFEGNKSWLIMATCITTMEA